MSIALLIDGQPVQVAAGATVLDAVNQLGLPLPQLCKDPDRPPLGACRTCLVQVDGVRGFPASCSTPVREGMVVSTQSSDAIRIRQGVLDLTLGMLPAAQRNGDRPPLGQLDAAAAAHGLERPSFAPLHAYPTDTSKSFFVFDRDNCILCGRCVVACDDVQEIGAIALIGKGHASKV